MNKWDTRFLELADHVASWSKDPNRQAGSVITKQKRIISLGFNGMPEGIPDDEEILNSSSKNLFMSHAERNAIDFAHVSLEGCTIYCSYFPCNECAKSIIQKRIVRVVTRRPLANSTKHNWDVSLYLFQKRGIEVVYAD